MLSGLQPLTDREHEFTYGDPGFGDGPENTWALVAVVPATPLNACSHETHVDTAALRPGAKGEVTLEDGYSRYGGPGRR